VTVPHWHDAPEVWDTLVLNDRPWPGVARVKVKRGRKYDRKEAGGANGETQTFKGTKAADVDITVRVHKKDWEAVQAELEYIEPFVGKAKVQPISIGHAVTAVRKVLTIQIEDVEGPDNGEDGVATFTIKAFEASKTNKANGSGTGKPKTHDQTCREAWEAHSKALNRYYDAQSADGGKLRSMETNAAYKALQDANAKLQALKCENWTPPSANKDAAKP
jgi:hypothetical protein